ncbi:MAG: hypothetical protein IKY30_08975 [Oscillospiraceae bacterium]|nr:hypothetical protein [Oscillospiraceae bacterium]
MNNQQVEYIETYKKRQNNSVIFNAIFLFGIIALRMLFVSSAYSPANESRATAKKELLGPGFHLSIEMDGKKKSTVFDDSRYTDMEFSPSGRYLLVEAENGDEYQMYIFDTNFVADSSQYYLIYDDLNIMAEWIFRGNDILKIKPDDKITLEFDSWDQEYNYMKFDYIISHLDGSQSSGFLWIDYESRTVIAINEEP